MSKPHIKKTLQINIDKTPNNKQTQPLRMTSEMVESARASTGLCFHHLDLDIRKIIRFERLHLKFLKRKNSVVFNWTCLYIYIYIYNFQIKFFKEKELLRSYWSYLTKRILHCAITSIQKRKKTMVHEYDGDTNCMCSS